MELQVRQVRGVEKVCAAIAAAHILETEEFNVNKNAKKHHQMQCLLSNAKPIMMKWFSSTFPNDNVFLKLFANSKDLLPITGIYSDDAIMEFMDSIESITDYIAQKLHAQGGFSSLVRASAAKLRETGACDSVRAMRWLHHLGGGMKLKPSKEDRAVDDMSFQQLMSGLMNNDKTEVKFESWYGYYDPTPLTREALSDIKISIIKFLSCCESSLVNVEKTKWTLTATDLTIYSALTIFKSEVVMHMPVYIGHNAELERRVNLVEQLMFADYPPTGKQLRRFISASLDLVNFITVNYILPEPVIIDDDVGKILHRVRESNSSLPQTQRWVTEVIKCGDYVDCKRLFKIKG